MFSVQGLIITFMFGYMMAIIVEGIKDIIKYNNQINGTHLKVIRVVYL